VTQVFANLSRGLRWVWPHHCLSLPTGVALTARQQSLGTVVMRQRFRQCCRTFARPETKGAFAFGLQLMAIDSTLDEVPDILPQSRHVEE